MTLSRPLICLIFFVAIISAHGSGCAINRQPNVAPTPIVFQQQPTLPEIIEAVNSNSSRVQQLHVENARLSIPGRIYSLRATLDFDRPRRVRLFAETSLTGRVLDLGSNDEVFWLWMQMGPPTVFYGRHDQFYQSYAQQVLPVPPHWLVEALGIVYLDPAGMHEQPHAARPGILQVRTRLPTPRGDLTRILEIDGQRAWIVQQLLYDAQGQKLASASASQFRYDPIQGVSLPGRVDVELPQLAFTFEADAYTINQPLPIDSAVEYRRMPELEGHRYRDVANPNDMREVLPQNPTNPTTNLGPPVYQGPGYTPATPAYQPANYPSPGNSPPPRAAMRRLPAFSAVR